MNTAQRTADPERERKRQRAYRAANRERVRETQSAWREANPDKRAAIAAKRRASKRNATVPLTPEEQAREAAIYAEAQRNGWEVDHIMPLALLGLHHPDNLVAIPGPMNKQKGAQYWPDLHALQ
jgi:hypothetical protein